MEIRPGDAPVDDPFWAAVRRRHPDVDLVVLPTVPTRPEDPGPPVDEETVGQALSDTAEQAAELWAAMPLSGAAQYTRLHYGGDIGSVRAVSRVVEHRSDGYGVLVSLRHELAERGWHVDRPPGGLERLVATRDGAVVKASYAEPNGVVLFELSSADLPVGRARARTLTRDA